MKKTIAEHMVDILNEEGEYDVDIRRPWLWVECFERSGMKYSRNSVKNGARVMDALEKSPYFEKRYIRYANKVRWFILKEEYRNKVDS